MTYDIKIKDVQKKFAKTTALDNLTLSVKEGEMLGLIGPDGAGKTTLLRILCALLYADSGEIRMGGLDPRRESRLVRGFLGYMPQRFSLYPDLTVAENLRFFADLFKVAHSERETRLHRLLQFSRLGPFVDRRAAALSGGMKQKLALSCTLIHTPKILLLDEPTTGVDPVSRREFWDILQGLRQEGVTILVTTPYMDEAAKCDRVAFIHKGHILSVASPAEIPNMFHKNLYEVRCDRNVAAARALQTCGQFESVQIFGDRIHLSCEEELPSLQQKVETCLKTAGVPCHSIEPVAATIEDVFVQLLR